MPLDSRLGLGNAGQVTKEPTGPTAATAPPSRSSLHPYYADYFLCFNRGLFFEAHESLEKLWLPNRNRPNDLFYRGLIQLAGAFVHLQKDRLRPAAALFEKARANLQRYPTAHEDLDVSAVLGLIDHWLDQLRKAPASSNPLLSGPPPKLHCY